MKLDTQQTKGIRFRPFIRSIAILTILAIAISSRSDPKPISVIPGYVSTNAASIQTRTIIEVVTVELPPRDDKNFWTNRFLRGAFSGDTGEVWSKYAADEMLAKLRLLPGVALTVLPTATAYGTNSVKVSDTNIAFVDGKPRVLGPVFTIAVSRSNQVLQVNIEMLWDGVVAAEASSGSMRLYTPYKLDIKSNSLISPRDCIILGGSPVREKAAAGMVQVPVLGAFIKVTVP